ncbi:MAG TPA: hypothetical protein VFF69_03425 [Phycisphaerales bacterium]|nr:hypothetical protein [Phycisphaerales bacterium]
MNKKTLGIVAGVLGVIAIALIAWNLRSMFGKPKVPERPAEQAAEDSRDDGATGGARVKPGARED